MTLRDSVLLLRGPTGSRVLLTVKRADMKPFDVLIVRALIHIQSVRWSLEKGIGYVRISSFTEKATREFVDAVVTMRSQAGDALQGIVLDLRNNPGGLLEQSVRISDELLEQGNIVSTQSRVDRNNFEAQSGDIAAGLRQAVRECSLKERGVVSIRAIKPNILVEQNPEREGDEQRERANLELSRLAIAR